MLRCGRKLGVQLKELISIVSYHSFRRWVRELPVLDRYRNFLANPPIEGLLVLKAIRTFEFAAKLREKGAAPGEHPWTISPG